MKFKLAKDVNSFEAWTNDGCVRLDEKNPSLETDDPAEIALLEASPAVVRDSNGGGKKKADS